MLFWLEFLNDQAENTEISEFYFLGRKKNSETKDFGLWLEKSRNP